MKLCTSFENFQMRLSAHMLPPLRPLCPRSFLSNGTSNKFSANCQRILLKTLFPQTVVQFVFSFLFFFFATPPLQPFLAHSSVVLLFMKCLKIRGAWTFCALVCLSFMLMDFTRTWTRAVVRRGEGRRQEESRYRMCSKLKDPQWVFQQQQQQQQEGGGGECTSMFSYIVSVAAYIVQTRYIHAVCSWCRFRLLGLRNFAAGVRD